MAFPAPSIRKAPPPLLMGGHLYNSLAMKLGDSVEVVSPLGEIGPNGPIPLVKRFQAGGWISAGLTLEETKTLIDKINSFREQFGTLDHPNYQFQVMGEAAYSPDGVKQLEDLGATEVIVAFRNAYEGGPDNRTLDGMIAEINWYAEEVINKVK